MLHAIYFVVLWVVVHPTSVHDDNQVLNAQCENNKGQMMNTEQTKKHNAESK